MLPRVPARFIAMLRRVPCTVLDSTTLACWVWAHTQPTPHLTAALPHGTARHPLPCHLPTHPPLAPPRRSTTMGWSKRSRVAPRPRCRATTARSGRGWSRPCLPSRRLGGPRLRSCWRCHSCRYWVEGGRGGGRVGAGMYVCEGGSPWGSGEEGKGEEAALPKEDGVAGEAALGAWVLCGGGGGSGCPSCPGQNKFPKGARVSLGACTCVGGDALAS